MFLQGNYVKAMHFAAKAHGDQKYPGKNYTYMVHISIVSMEIIAAMYHINDSRNLNWDFAVQCSILHDVLEDTKVQFDSLKDEFGEDIAKGVQALTKDESIEKDKQIEDSIKRIKNESKEIWMVKLADRITNLREPPDYWDNSKKSEYLKEAKLIYNELNIANVYLAGRLKEKISQYDKYIV